jgi:hypothetical protein
MINIKTGVSYSEIPIEKGQNELFYDYKIGREDQISGCKLGYNCLD